MEEEKKVSNISFEAVKTSMMQDKNGAKTKKKSLMGSQVSREPDITNSMY